MSRRTIDGHRGSIMLQEVQLERVFKKHREVVVKVSAGEPRGLRGFNCGNYQDDLEERNFYIDNDFSFKHW